MISKQEQIEVQQAHLDGKAVECRAIHDINPDDYWKEFVDEFEFDWAHGEYRIKPEAPPPPPEPREFRATYIEHEADGPDQPVTGDHFDPFIKVREVIE